MDELTDFIVQRPDLGKSFTRSLTRLASKGAAFGIILIILTQNPKAKIIDTLIRGNMTPASGFPGGQPGALKDHPGSERQWAWSHQLPRTHRGRMMARLDGALTEMQGYYVSDEMIRQVVTGIRARNGRARATAKIVDPRAYTDESRSHRRGEWMM